MTRHVIPLGAGRTNAFGQGVGATTDNLPAGVRQAENNRPDRAGAPPPQVSAPAAIATQLEVLLSNVRIAADRLLGMPPNCVKPKILESLFSTYTTIQENIGSTYAALKNADNPVRLLQVQRDADKIGHQVTTFIQTVEEYVSKYGTAAFAQATGVSGLGATADSSKMWLWWTIGAVAVAGVGYYFYARRKTRRVKTVHEV